MNRTGKAIHDILVGKRMQIPNGMLFAERTLPMMTVSKAIVH